MLFIRRVLHPNVPSTSTRSPFFLDVRWTGNDGFRQFSNVADVIKKPVNLVTVSTTGYSFVDSNGKRSAKYGVYWGEDDPRNCIRTLPAGGTYVSAMFSAILEVVNVAREEDPPPSLLIYSDLETSSTLLRDLSIWSKRDFYQRNHETKMKHAQLLHSLFLAVQGLQLKIEHRPTSTREKPENSVTAAILKGVRKRIDEKDMEKSAIEESLGKEKYCNTENPVEPMARIELEIGETLDKEGSRVSVSDQGWPVVYVAAKCTNINDFISAGYCTHWPDGQCAGGRSHRFVPFPVTLFRAELAAIEEALKQAVDEGIPKLTIITSSALFMSAWRRHWIRDGEKAKPFTGKVFYERISDLCKRLEQVHFCYNRLDAKSDIGRELDNKCTQGLSYALMGKDKSEYELETEDIVRGKEFRCEGVPIVRLYKSGTGMNAGYVWQDSEKGSGVSCCGTPSTLIRILEEAVARNESTIVIRADSEKLIKSYEAHLEVWRRNGWRNSQHKRISKSAEWEKAWNLKQKLQVNWEIMNPLDDDDLLENKQIPTWQRS